MRHGSDTAGLLPDFFRTTIGVGSAYFVVGLIGMALAVPPSNATLIFPAAGLAVAAALRFGRPAILAVAAGFVEPGEGGRVWLNWYTGDTLGVFIFAPLMLVLLHAGDEGHATSGDWQVIWRMGAILALSIVAFLGVRRWEAWAREATLHTDALTIAKDVAGWNEPASSDAWHNNAAQRTCC